MRLQTLGSLVIGLMQIANAQTPKQPGAKQAPDPRGVVLVGDRFRPLKYDQMTREQKVMIDHLFAGERGGARGPFIAAGKRPTGMPPNTEAAYNFVDELLTTHQVTDVTFQAAKQTYGEKSIVDIMGLSGWYGLVSMVLDVDRYPLGPGVEPELQPLDDPLPIVGSGFATPIPGTASPASAKSTVYGKTFALRGDRFRPLTYEEMDPEQKKMTDHASAGRGPVGMFNITVRSPEAGDLLFAMGDRVRFHMSVPDKLKELAIILTARYWAAQFEWLAHRRAAVQAGLIESKVKAIAEGKRPVGMSPDEEAVYNFVCELFKTRRVSDETFATIKKVVGERGVVDLLASVGFYQIVSMYMNVDRLPLAENQVAELKYSAKPLP